MSDIKIGDKVYNGVSRIIAKSADGSSDIKYTNKLLKGKQITSNGTYEAKNDNFDGYETVEVNVSGGGGGDDTLLKCLIDGVTECIDPKFSNIKAIRSYACSGNLALKGNLVLPNEITDIGSGAFSSCKGLTGTLTLPNSIRIIDSSVFKQCVFTGNLKLPDTIKEIGSYSFQFCSSFTGNLVLPSTIEVIKYFAFQSCSGLNGKLIFPSTLRDIQIKAFYGCSGFETTMRCEAVTPPRIEVDTLPEQITTVEVPMESVDAYKSAAEWSNYTIVGY